MTVEQKYCTQCGFRINETDNFCGSCGVVIKKLPRSESAQDVNENNKEKIIVSNENLKRISGKTEYFMLLIGIIGVVSGIAVIYDIAFLIVLFSIVVMVKKRAGFDWLGAYVFFYLLSTIMFFGYYGIIVNDTSRASEFVNDYPTSLLKIFILPFHSLLLSGMFYKKIWASRLHPVLLIELVLFIALANYADSMSKSIIIAPSFLFLLPAWFYFYNAKYLKN